MIDRRLLKEIPEAKQFIMKQVGMQWISLMTNIAFIFLLVSSIMMIKENTMTPYRIGFMLIGVVVLLIIRTFSTKKAMYYAYLASKDVKDILRKRLFEKLLQLKNNYTTYVSTSELVQLSVEGIDQLEIYFGRYLPQFFYSMLAPLTLFVILVWIDLYSAIVLLIAVPLIPLSIIAIQKIAKKLLAKYWNSYVTLGDSFLENLQGLTTLKIYQADEYKNEQMNREAENFRKITMKVLTMQLNSVSVMDIVAYGGSALGCIIAMMGYMQGRMSLFGVLCILLLAAEFFIPLRLLGSYFHVAMNGISASNKIFRILDLKIDESKKQQLKEQEIDIQFKNVSFSYDQQRSILKDISLHIQPKMFIGIVGESGSGKSTCAKLIGGFASQYEGNILLQGIERSQIDDASFYEHVMYITHKPTILKGTLRENLLMGNPEASDLELIEVLKQVKLYDFINNTRGLDTEIQEQGSNLSGGQNQRISIARALLTNRELYIFDEATSNIDVESEEAILEAIRVLTTSKTVIMITHHLRNVMQSNCIYVLEQGKCVEQGTHEALLESKNTYARLFHKQQDLERLEGDYTYA